MKITKMSKVGLMFLGKKKTGFRYWYTNCRNCHAGRNQNWMVGALGGQKWILLFLYNFMLFLLYTECCSIVIVGVIQFWFCILQKTKYGIRPPKTRNYFQCNVVNETRLFLAMSLPKYFRYLLYIILYYSAGKSNFPTNSAACSVLLFVSKWDFEERKWYDDKHLLFINATFGQLMDTTRWRVEIIQRFQREETPKHERRIYKERKPNNVFETMENMLNK